MKGDGVPFFGVPPGSVRVENPDGVYQGSYMKHSLYDNPLSEPIIPGDYDQCLDVHPTNDAGRLHGR